MTDHRQRKEMCCHRFWLSPAHALSPLFPCGIYTSASLCSLLTMKDHDSSNAPLTQLCGRYTVECNRRWEACKEMAGCAEKGSWQWKWKTGRGRPTKTSEGERGRERDSVQCTYCRTETKSISKVMSSNRLFCLSSGHVLKKFSFLWHKIKKGQQSSWL